MASPNFEEESLIEEQSLPKNERKETLKMNSQNEIKNLPASSLVQHADQNLPGLPKNTSSKTNEMSPAFLG